MWIFNNPTAHQKKEVDSFYATPIHPRCRTTTQKNCPHLWDPHRVSSGFPLKPRPLEKVASRGETDFVSVGLSYQIGGRIPNEFFLFRCFFFQTQSLKGTVSGGTFVNIRNNSPYFFKPPGLKNKNDCAGPLSRCWGFAVFWGVNPLIFDFQQVGFLYTKKGDYTWISGISHQ